MDLIHSVYCFSHLLTKQLQLPSLAFDPYQFLLLIHLALKLLSIHRQFAINFLLTDHVTPHSKAHAELHFPFCCYHVYALTCQVQSNILLDQKQQPIKFHPIPTAVIAAQPEYHSLLSAANQPNTHLFLELKKAMKQLKEHL